MLKCKIFNQTKIFGFNVFDNLACFKPKRIICTFALQHEGKDFFSKLLISRILSELWLQFGLNHFTIKLNRRGSQCFIYLSPDCIEFYNFISFSCVCGFLYFGVNDAIDVVVAIQNLLICHASFITGRIQLDCFHVEIKI